MNASLSRFALQLSNIGLADFGYTAQLAFRSAVATSIGSNFTHDAVTIESFALASSAWDADSATRRRLSTELRLTVRFQIHAETVPDFAVNISHLRAAGAGLEFVTSISETAVLTSSTTVKPRRAPAHTTSDWRVTVLAPGIVEGLHDPPMVRFGDWNGSDVQIVSINGGRDVVMQATAPSVPEAAVVALEVSLNSVDFTDSKLAFVFERYIQVEFLLFHAARCALIAVCCARTGTTTSFAAISCARTWGLDCDHSRRWLCGRRLRPAIGRLQCATSRNARARIALAFGLGYGQSCDSPRARHVPFRYCSRNRASCERGRCL